MIAGELAALRAVEPDDLELLRTWRNRPTLRRYFREHRELTRADQEAWYERLGADERMRMFAIVDPGGEPPPLVGAAGLCYVDWVRRSAELSLYIGIDDLYVDDRLAPDALRLLLRYAFDDLGLHRVWAEVYSFDERKSSLYERFGFQIDGRHRDSHFADGRWHDSVYFSLLEGEQPGRA
jgi:RimJ/RimL family protein N-acetyltransferase